MVIADDLDVIRVGIRRVLSKQPDLEIVGEAENGREAVELCRSLKPDIVVMDVQMPEMDGIEATRKIKAEMPAIAVLVLTAYEDPDYLLEAVRAGAAGFVLKQNALLRVTEAVRTVLGGGSTLDQGMAMRLLRNLSAPYGTPGNDPKTRAQHERAINALTRRELEILAYLARGYTNGRIAEDLVLSVGTVKTHVHRVISKLGVSDRTQAVVRAIRIGLVSPES